MRKLAFAFALFAAPAAMAQNTEVQIGQGRVQIQRGSMTMTQACKMSTACNSAQMQFYAQWIRESKGPSQASTSFQQQAQDGWQTTDAFFQQQQGQAVQQEGQQGQFYKSCMSYYQTLKQMSPQIGNQANLGQTRQQQANNEGNKEPHQAASLAQNDLLQVIQINAAVSQALEGYKLCQFANTKTEGQKLIQTADTQIEQFKTGSTQVVAFYKQANDLIDSMQMNDSK